MRNPKHHHVLAIGVTTLSFICSLDFSSVCQTRHFVYAERWAATKLSDRTLSDRVFVSMCDCSGKVHADSYALALAINIVLAIRSRMLTDH